MNLAEFDWLKTTDVDLAFPTFSTDPELLKEAESRRPLLSKAIQKFNELFYRGGEVKFKQGVSVDDEGWQRRAWRYMKSYMGGYNSKHEHKEIICAMIIDELCEL